MLKQKKYKIARRLGPDVFDKTQTEKFALREAQKKTQQRGGRRRAPSEYGKQLLEKQKIRFAYGISERQFRKYVEEARKQGGQAAEYLMTRLESRLDNIVYRLGLAPSRRAGRQMVSHGHVLVNGERTRAPSYHITVGDTISVREGSKAKPLFEVARERLKEHAAPSWLSMNAGDLSAKVEKMPVLPEHDQSFDPTVVIEFYSR